MLAIETNHTQREDFLRHRHEAHWSDIREAYPFNESKVRVCIIVCFMYQPVDANQAERQAHAGALQRGNH